MIKLPYKIIFHIDMNSYFASCEQQANPFLRGKPVGVCEHLGGIIIAPSIEAKKLGIKTGTPVWEAKKIFPKIVLLHTDPDKYRHITAGFLRVLSSYTEEIQKYSIDEAFLDMTSSVSQGKGSEETVWIRSAEIAKEIKARIKSEVGDWLKCSVGISTSKLLAKIGSDMQKPDGLTLIKPEDISGLYDKLKLTDIPGIARRTEKSLNLLGIKTLKDLRDYPSENLVANFGVLGYHLHKMGQLQGSWDEENFESEEQSKSMGHAYTLPNAISDRNVANQVLCKLSEMVGRRLRASGLQGNVIKVVIGARSGAFESKQRKIGSFIDDGHKIYSEAADILAKDFISLQSFKLVGVTVAGLVSASGQNSLFETDKRAGRLVKYLDKINDKYGDFTISRMSAWQARGIIRDSIGFGRMKEFHLNFKRRK